MNRAILLLVFGLLSGCATSPGEPEPEKENAAPVITSLKATPARFPAGGVSTISCTATDADNDKLTYEWKTNGLGYLFGSGSTVTFSAASCCIGPNEIEVTVSDPNGASASKSIIVTVY